MLLVLDISVILQVQSMPKTKKLTIAERQKRISEGLKLSWKARKMPRHDETGMPKQRFWIERLGDSKGPDKPGDAFAIYAATFDELGDRKGSMIINIFIGPDRREAERYRDLLNDAVEQFHAGLPV